jgi:hypothetical protein
MAQLAFTYPNFSISSSWEGYYDPPPTVYYSTPSTRTANPVFALTGLPADAVIDSAILTAALGSPYTGAAIRQVDGVPFSGSMDVTAKIQALNGNYGAGVSFEYKFKANGGQGGFGDHSSSLGFSSNTLTITYHMPASTGSLDKGSVDAGANIKIQITPGSSAYTHKVIWSMNGQTVTHTLAAGVTEDTLTVPTSWMNTIPNTESGQAQCQLETYSGSTLMGSNTYYFIMTVPASVMPTVSIAVTPYSDVSPAVPDAWGLYVKGKSKARVAANAAGAGGSSIVGYRFTEPGQSNPYTSGLLSAAGQVTYTCEVTDSRGRKTTSAPISITVLDYSPPTIGMPLFNRCLSDKTLSESGTYIRVRATLGITSLSGKNAVTKRMVYYRQTGSVNWLPANGVDLASLTPDIAIGGGGISTDYTYQVKIELADSLTPSDNPAVYIGYIASKVIYDLRPDRAALGRRASNTKQFSIPDDWSFVTGLGFVHYQDNIGAYGSSNNDMNTYTAMGVYQLYGHTGTHACIAWGIMLVLLTGTYCMQIQFADAGWAVWRAGVINSNPPTWTAWQRFTLTPA